MIKGESIVLFSDINKNKKIDLIINWEISTFKFKVFEIDAFAFLLNDKDKVRSDFDFIFHKKDGCLIQEWQKIKHNTTDEKFTLDFSKIDEDVNKIVFGLNIYKGEERSQSFNNLLNLNVSILENNIKINDFKLDYSEENIVSMILCEIYRYSGVWKIRAVAQGFEGGMKFIEKFYGVNQ